MICYTSHGYTHKNRKIKLINQNRKTDQNRNTSIQVGLFQQWRRSRKHKHLKVLIKMAIKRIKMDNIRNDN